MTKTPLTILLASPRGFCAGVDRAIQIVETALTKYGRPVYVRHEIVHNRFVVSSLEAKGAVFVDELDEVPADRPVVFSAHGVPKSVPAEAQARGMFYLDATCPLVTKVHHEAERHAAEDRQIIMIGHAGHPEVVGTMGQVENGRVLLVENNAQAETIEPSQPEHLAYITQTTLSVDDTAQIVATLKRRFPAIEGPKKEDICFATTNRQQAVTVLAPDADLVLVIGSKNSSNSLRLVETARAAGKVGYLIDDERELDTAWFDGVETVLVTAGASAPEHLVDGLVERIKRVHGATVESRTLVEEDTTFDLPKSARSLAVLG